MSGAALRVEVVAAGAPHDAGFERVREAVGIYGAIGPEAELRDGTRLVAWRGDAPVARCACVTAAGLHGAPGLTGMIGNYEALDLAAGSFVLEHAQRALAALAVARVLGPMNGDTWSRYRLVLPADSEQTGRRDPPFLSEPCNPPDYHEHFSAAGFKIAARYESRIDESLGQEAAGAAELAARVRAAGIHVRPLDLARFEDELRTLLELSLVAFAENPFYTPLGFGAFRAAYEKLRPLLDPELVLIAEDPAGTPVGFQFAFVDPLSLEQGRPTRAVVKTVATTPAARGRGLAGHMLDVLRRSAHERGCRATIHALMHVRNFSMNMSARHLTRPFRRYALFQWVP